MFFFSYSFLIIIFFNVYLTQDLTIYIPQAHDALASPLEVLGLDQFTTKPGCQTDIVYFEIRLIDQAFNIQD